MEVGCDADVSGKTPFDFQGGNEHVGSLVFLCRPYYLIPRTRDNKTAHSHILSLRKNVHQHKEKIMASQEGFPDIPYSPVVRV
jgi:hypothetical protein